MAWAKSPPLVFHSVTAKNAAELADTAAMFVVVRAKSNLEIPNGNEGARFQHLTKAHRIISQFGQTPMLARIDAALADLG